MAFIIRPWSEGSLPRLISRGTSVLLCGVRAPIASPLNPTTMDPMRALASHAQTATDCRVLRITWALPRSTNLLDQLAAVLRPTMSILSQDPAQSATRAVPCVAQVPPPTCARQIGPGFGSQKNKNKKACEPPETTDTAVLRCRGKLFCPFHGKAAVRCSPDEVQKQAEEDSVAGPKCEGNNPVKSPSHLLPSR